MALAASSSATGWGVETMIGAGDGHVLGGGHGGVAGAGRQVDDEVVELAPGHVAEELLDAAADHRPAPDDGRAGREQEADRDELDAVALDGVQALLAVGLEAGGQAEHGGQVGAGDVGVEQADGGAALGEGDGEVGGDGGLADAALVRGDGDDVADAVDGLGTGGRGRAVLGAVRVGRAGCGGRGHGFSYSGHARSSADGFTVPAPGVTRQCGGTLGGTGGGRDGGATSRADGRGWWDRDAVRGIGNSDSAPSVFVDMEGRQGLHAAYRNERGRLDLTGACSDYGEAR